MRLGVSMITTANGFLQNTTKQRWTFSVPAEVLGVGVEFDHLDPALPMRWSVSAEKRLHTAALISNVLASGNTHVTDHLCDHIMGKEIWSILVERSFLSIFSETYVRRHDPHRKRGLVWLSPAMRVEWKLAKSLCCFFETVSRPLSSKVAIFDASGGRSEGFGGYGVVARDGLTDEAAAEILSSVLGGGSTALPSYKISDTLQPPTDSAAAARTTAFLLQDRSRRFPAWRVVRAGEFRYDPGHINSGEAITGGMAATFLAGARGTRGHRVFVGGDNTASLCAFRKGRSSARRINRVCRKLAVLSVLCSISFVWFWLPSKANAADEPSREWLQRLRSCPDSTGRQDPTTAWVPRHGPGGQPPPISPVARPPRAAVPVPLRAFPPMGLRATL
jgi:hypothetical protein